MEKVWKHTDSKTGETATLLIDIAGFERLMAAANRNPTRRSGSGPFLVQLDRQESKEKGNSQHGSPTNDLP